MSTTHATPNTMLRWHWLVAPRFDLFFIVGLVTLSILTAYTVVFFTNLFLPILILDLWFLGYHHVISTYTRLCFDKQSFQQHKWMIFGLLPAVAMATLAVAYFVGMWAIITIYFYWQWFHYTRQSWGVSRAYRAKDKDAVYEDGWLDQAIFYSVPFLGILYRSYQDPDTFITFELWVVPVASWMVNIVALATVALLGYWVLRRGQAWLEGRLNATHMLYVLSHITIFGVGYIAIEDVTYGWLAINIWHNAQYILFVWMFNQKRFKSGLDPKARFLSYISQPGRLWLYMTVCLGLTILLYTTVFSTLDSLLIGGLAGTLVTYQIVNFHHYVVDSFIWKVRSEPMRKTLDLQQIH